MEGSSSQIKAFLIMQAFIVESTDIKESLKHIQVAKNAKVFLSNLDFGRPVTLVHIEPTGILSHASEIILCRTFFLSISVR
jgi:hypothetical protein